MEPILVLRFTVLVVLLLLSAAFSAAEIALFSLTPGQVQLLKDSYGARGIMVSRLLENPSRLLVTIYMGNEIINVSIAAVSTIIGLHIFGEAGVAYAIGIGTFLLLVFADVMPKTFAFRHNQGYSLFISYPLYFFSKLVRPFQFLISSLTEWLLNLTGKPGEEVGPEITEEEMKTALTHGEMKGVIETDQKEMIMSIFELGDTMVTEIMTPRTEIFSLPLEEGFDTVAKRAALSNYSRIPIYRKDPDHVVGILYTKDLLETKDGDDVNLEKMLHEAYIIPPTKKIDELLREFRKKHTHVAIVMNEYGGVDGLVSLEDILEEVMGEEVDPADEDAVHEVEPGVYFITGRLSLDEFNKRFGTELEVEDIDTVGGLVFHLLGRMPKVGETVSADGASFTVAKMKGAKIWHLTATVKDHEEKETTDGDDDDGGEKKT